jgi:hypothetical protein
MNACKKLYSFPMLSGSRRPGIGAVLVVFLLLPVLSDTALAQVSPDTTNTECKASPSSCIFGRLLAVLAAPYTHPFSDLRTTYDPGKPSVLGARLEHRFRTLGVADERMHPYFGVGFLLRYEQYETGMAWTGTRVRTEANFEVAVGYQWAAAPLLQSVMSWDAPIVATTELQWRPFRETGRARFEVGPGISLPLSSDRRLGVRVPISFPLGSTRTEGVRIGVGVVYNWK